MASFQFWESAALTADAGKEVSIMGESVSIS
jgi:hypothetical protein